MFWSKSKSEAKTANKPWLVAFRTEENGMMVNIDPSQIESPAIAGIMLADIMRHMARAMTQYGSAGSEAEATSAMLELFQAEVESPTDLGSGSIVN